MKLILHLPLPPSMNRIRRIRRGVASKDGAVYAAWKSSCDGILMASGTRQWRNAFPSGDLLATIAIDEGLRVGRIDLDNRIKAVLDWVQRVEIIGNDRQVVMLLASWADTNGTPCLVGIEPVKPHDGLVVEIVNPLRDPPFAMPPERSARVKAI